MGNTYFQFKQFTVRQELAAMKVTTDACLFGAWVASSMRQFSGNCSNVLDIGSGTGLLSLMVAQASNAIVDAIDIDKGAYNQTVQNFQHSPWQNRLKAFLGNVSDTPLPGKYDVIICNPPFYENDLTGINQQKNIAHHNAGLLLKDLFDIIHSNLAANGRFFILLPYKRFDETMLLLSKRGLHSFCICKVSQSVHHGFFRVMISGSNSKSHTDTRTEELAIRDSDNKYTEAFIDLLKPYYLHL